MHKKISDLIKEDTSKEEYDDDDGEEEIPPAKSIRLIYLEKLFLLFKAIFIVADHVTDIILIVTLFEMKQRWFGSIYLAVDVFPAAIIMWSKYRSEKSWKVLVTLFLKALLNYPETCCENYPDTCCENYPDTCI